MSFSLPFIGRSSGVISEGVLHQQDADLIEKVFDLKKRASKKERRVGKRCFSVLGV